MNANTLLIPDLQIPFHHPKALEFCLYVKRHHRIGADNALCVGDETDQYFASLYDKDPDADMSPHGELRQSIEELKRWYAAFPRLRLCKSNHADRWEKRAKKLGLPSFLLKPYREVIQAPAGWRWQDIWRVGGSHPYMVEHGHEGAADSRQRAIDNGVSTANGHFHAKAGIAHVRTRGGKSLWGMNVGCLIDVEAFAFHYNRKDRFRPTLGVGVVLDGGRTPLWIPYG